MSQFHNPYAPPQVDPVFHGAAGGGVVRDGILLVIQRGSEGNLPMNCCIKCGSPVAKRVTKSFSWHSPFLYLTILAGLLIYVIIALIVQKSMKLSCPLCVAHQRRRRLLTFAAWGAFLGVFGAFALGGALDLEMGICAVLATGFLVTSLVLALQVSNMVVKPKRITESLGVFTGAGEAYLAILPPSPGAGRS